MDCKLRGKVAVITGGAQGIGRAAANALAGEGAIVVMGDLTFESGGLRRQQFDGDGELYGGYLDVANKDVVDEFFGYVVQQFKTVDIFYSNAGICKGAVPFEETPDSSWKAMFSVNTMGGVYCLNKVIPLMKKQRSGKIIMSASIAAEVGGIRTVPSYGASKAANIAITMSLAKQLGPYRINVNAVSPGIIGGTGITNGLDAVDPATIPLQRYGTGADMGNIIVFLSCHMSDYLTGVVLDVNGGQYFR